MKTFIIIILAIASTSCHILKKDKLTLKTLSQKEELQIQSQRNIRSHKSQLMIIDSSHNDFTMMLWPKGKFKFSVVNGFEGEADKILIKGKQTNQKIINSKQETKQDSIQFKANYTNEKESTNINKKNKLSVGYNWSWGLGLLIIFVLIWVYRKLKLRF